MPDRQGDRRGDPQHDGRQHGLTDRGDDAERRQQGRRGGAGTSDAPTGWRPAHQHGQRDKVAQHDDHAREPVVRVPGVAWPIDRLHLGHAARVDAEDGRQETVHAPRQACTRDHGAAVGLEAAAAVVDLSLIHI